MKDLIVIDDFLSKEDHHKIYDLTMKRKWHTTNDEGDDPLSGQSGYNSHDDDGQGEGTQIIIKECLKHEKLIEILKTNYMRTTYNKYDPKTPTYFHTDTDGGWTLVYFPHISEYNFQMGGETQILISNTIVGVLPLPNRLMAFEGSLNHKGTSFTNNQYRYSLAIQFRD